MADALKLADMQRASVEFERQRHLANWLIESSPHMPMVTPQQQQKQAQQLTKKGAAKAFKQNPIFFLAKIGHNMNLTGSANAAAAAAPGPPPNLLSTNSIASTFNSQTNLPLAIVSSSGRDGHKPKLRRFNSHDTSANMFSVAEFENARLARRNEIENAALLRQRQRYKLNSLSSGGGDCSTGESKGSKLSNDSTGEPLFAEHFLEKFSLPRVVRVSYTSDSGVGSSSSGDQTMTSSSSAESTSTSERKKKKKGQGGSTTCSSPANGELFLLYRYMRNYKVYHVFNSKSGSNRKKGYKIPQDYPGYFSFLTEKGAAAATAYTTIVQLVRERVYKFLSLENLSAYTETHDNYSHKTHYVKATAKAGQVYRLLAVFQDGDKGASSSSSSQKDAVSLGGSGSGADKERGKYAQLLGDNRQIYYVSLSAKGKFYEIEQHTAPVLQKSSSLGHPNSNSKTPKQLNRECVHRIGFIMQSEVKLPLNLKLIASMAASGSQTGSVPEYITIAKISVENFTVACPIDEQEYASSLTLTKLHTSPQLKFTKCSLGFDSEQRMFLNAAIQTVLKFCQFNCDNFTRVVDNDANWAELQQLMNAVQQQQNSANSLNHLAAAGSSGGTVTKSEMLKKLRLTRLFGSGGERNQGSSSGHEKEDSIIFLSKNDLESLECGQQQQQNQQLPEHDQQPMSLASGMSDRMKVFTPSKKKWFKGLRSSQEVDGEGDEQEKRQSSIDRYKDMSRLIQERFGDIDISGMSVPRANSDIGYDDIVSGNPEEIGDRESGLQKCLSLQHIEIKTDSGMDIRNKDKPDLVNNISLSEREEVLSESEDTIFFPIRSSAAQQSFMTQKLYSEFHVKTKQHSKSQSSIQHLLNLASPQKLQDGKNKSRDKKRSEIVLSFEDLQSLNREEDLAGEGSNPHRNRLSILDDLPYSSVRDSIIIQEAEPHPPPSESIYAEICAETPPTVAAPPPRPEKRFTSIRINVPSSDAAVSHNPAGSRCAAAVASPVEDNIYNTIK
ncbi:uncharacterized protein LOC6031333 [Culex quinquefasciatus]|uniref:uncharacterized protein LOC6031333 n=1 Tax=Culex quinquefasciatus TaxID=7176 RepID=UPI0018E3782F|nr:uncharacterized protein LOC6031333 [Culex quinquefasciatus]